MKRLGSVLFYIGGCVWIVYAVAKYLLGWDVNIRQFLPYHLAAVIPGVMLKYGFSVVVSRVVSSVHFSREGLLYLNLKKTAVIFNGFIHDFAAGIWLATVGAIAVLHNAHLKEPTVVGTLNHLERMFFWWSAAAALLIMATGAGRTFTYVDNWYGEDAERGRRKALIVKHLVLFSAYALGYFWVWDKVFH